MAKENKYQITYPLTVDDNCKINYQMCSDMAKSEERFVCDNLNDKEKNPWCTSATMTDFKDNYFNHQDIKFTTEKFGDKVMSIDVKGRKRYWQNKSDSPYRHWVELKNNAGKQGWAFSTTTDYFAFHCDDGYYFVTPKDLQLQINKGVALHAFDYTVDKLGYNYKEIKPKENEFYRHYTRKRYGHDDLMLMIPDDDIKKIAKMMMTNEGKVIKLTTNQHDNIKQRISEYQD